VLRNIQKHGYIDAPTPASRENSIEFLRLTYSSRESVKDETLIEITVSKLSGDRIQNDMIWNQLAVQHIPLDHTA
jgi:hypothetical protein